jgi:hypothetical protein
MGCCYTIKPLPSRQVVELSWFSRVIPIEKSSNNDILFYKGNITNYFKEILFRVMTKDFCWSSFLRPVLSQGNRRYCWLISYRGFGFSVSCANHVPELDLRSLRDLTRRNWTFGHFGVCPSGRPFRNQNQT